MEDSKTLLCSSNFPSAHETISLKFTDNLGTRPQKGSPALQWGNMTFAEKHGGRLWTGCDSRRLGSSYELL